MKTTGQPIDINPTHLETIQRILDEHVPDCEVRVFGSRAKWNASDYSDLDLAVVGDQPLEWRILSRLETAFEESDLPFRVDVLDWHDISGDFKEMIEKDYVIFGSSAKESDSYTKLQLGKLIHLTGGSSTNKSAYTKSGYIAYSAKGPDGYLPYADYDRPGIVISSIGANCGKTWLAKGKWSCINNTICLWSIDPRVDTEYLYWITRDPDFWPKRGSAQPFIARSDIRNLEISFPSLSRQRRIAHVLGTLEDKIKVNRRLSMTLEAIAQALFKSWFIDFDPVRAKAEGRWRLGESIFGLPAHLYDLFPARLVPSELGEIPESWKVQRLGEIIELSYGKSLTAAQRNYGSIPVYGSNGQVGWHNRKLVDGPGIIVGRKGNPGTVKLTYYDFFPIDTTFYVIPKSTELGLAFLYFSLAFQDFISISSDSAVPGLNRDSAYMNTHITPNQEILKEFARLTNETLLRQHFLAEENYRLMSLQDVLLSNLLPKE